ncbi:MAG: YgfZ/GcvT domain-containing protein [Hyphomicrobiales bacterium]
MAGTHCATLESRAVIEMTGAEARGFLDNLITVNMAGVDENTAGYGALLTPQGKILFDFFIIAAGDAFLFDCAASQRDEFIKRLTFYKLRAKVEIADRSGELCVAALWGDDVPGDAGYADPRTPLAGRRMITPAEDIASTDAQPASEDAYHAHRISLGLGDTDADIGSGEMFPHEANFDQFGGVDFAKGCYVGQEVVSRMEHRATARKRLVPILGDGVELTSGASVTGNGKPIGAISSVSASAGLALLRLDRAQDCYNGGGELDTGGATLTLVKPAWARFELPSKKAA